jgi:hypothetical protein
MTPVQIARAAIKPPVERIRDLRKIAAQIVERMGIGVGDLSGEAVAVL